MLRYVETNWKHMEGCETHNYPIIFDKIQSLKTIKEQEQEREEKISLVLFFKNKERIPFLKICHRLKENNKCFQYDENKKFHATLLGFPIIKKEDYEKIREKIQQFCKVAQGERKDIKFDMVRLGTKYHDNNPLIPINGISNGTVIAIGNNQSKDFICYGDKLGSFMLNDEKLKSILGRNFRRKFPTVWCTLGYYDEYFNVTNDLENIFNEYRNVGNKDYEISFSDLELGISKYRDHRDWKLIQKFEL